MRLQSIPGRIFVRHYTNVHPIDSLHLDASELNEIISFEEVRRAVFADEDTKSPGF